MCPGANFIEYMDFGYTVKGKRTGLCYKGYVQLGEKITSTSIPDYARKAAIKRWIRNINFFPGPSPCLIVDWDIPPDQQLVQLEFATRYLRVNLSENLGVPAHSFNAEDVEVLESEIRVRPFPKDYTWHRRLTSSGLVISIIGFLNAFFSERIDYVKKVEQETIFSI
jgi:hypothetical protein